MFTYILLDVETTGLDFRTDRVISVGAKVFQENNFFHQHINPHKLNNAVHINGIDDVFLSKQPSFKHVMQQFWNWIDDVYHTFKEKPIVFVGHNYDYFDETMLLNEHIRTNMLSYVPQKIPMFKIDTMKLAKYVFPFTLKNNVFYNLPSNIDCPESYSQVNIYRFLFQQDPTEQHSAIGDVCALEQILLSDLFYNSFLLCSPDVTRLIHK
jgi:DNA polymerase III epsilon subunit-like protein